MISRMSLIIVAVLCSYSTLSLSSEFHPKPAMLSKTEIKALNTQANNGDPTALVKMGDLYYFGRGVEHNVTKAFQCYKKASELGDELADYRLGSLYSKGRGVERNQRTAVSYYEKAAQKGLVAAQMRMAFFYEKGTGVERDPRKALEWYRKAAAKGHSQAQYKLGLALANGSCVKADIPQAVAWLERAAKQGSQLSNVCKNKLQDKVTPQALAAARLQVEHEIHAQVSQI